MKFTLGTYLTELRKDKSLSQRELAKLVGCSYSQIARIENGDIESPGLQLVLAISKVLQVHPMKLIMAFEGHDPRQTEQDQPDESLMRTAFEEALKNVLQTHSQQH